MGMFLYYGTGLGIEASIGFFTTEMVALGVFAFQILFSMLWFILFSVRAIGMGMANAHLRPLAEHPEIAQPIEEHKSLSHKKC